MAQKLSLKIYSYSVGLEILYFYTARKLALEFSNRSMWLEIFA
jgi:hypothetical protein